jgi:hypothetical protein
MTPATGGALELNPDLDLSQHLPSPAAQASAEERCVGGISPSSRRNPACASAGILLDPKSKRFIKQLGASAVPTRLGTRFAIDRITAEAVGKEHGNEDGGLFDLLDDLWRYCADVRIHWPRLRVDRGRDRWCRNQTGAVAIEGQRYQLVQR